MKHVACLLISLFLYACAGLYPQPYTGTYDVELVSVERPAEVKERYGKSDTISTVAGDAGITEYKYEDELFRTYWRVGKTSIHFRIENKTDHSIKVIWDEAVYISIDKSSERVMHLGVKYTERNNSQPPTIIPRKGNVSLYSFKLYHVLFNALPFLML